MLLVKKVHILVAIEEMSNNQFCLMFSEYMKTQGMEHFKITVAQHVRLINL
jgi:hypothetical protein